MKNGTGLVAGQNFVDIVELKESGKKFVLEKSARIDIAEDGKPPSPDKRDELTQKAIRDAFKKSKAKSNNVVVGLAGSHAIVRRFRTVYVPKEQRQEAVKFEAQRYIPFKLDEIMSDFSVVAEAPDKNTMDALFIGANKNEVEKFTANFPKAGVKPSILSIEPMAIARLLKVCGAVEPDDNAAVVYVDEDRSGFIVML
ncbi:MAG: pilus assembly protein PilM, partial [Candidatus Omnitrophota bacterium]